MYVLHDCPYLDVNLQDNEGNTALMIASQAGAFTQPHCLPAAYLLRVGLEVALGVETKYLAAGSQTLYTDLSLCVYLLLRDELCVYVLLYRGSVCMCCSIEALCVYEPL